MSHLISATDFISIQNNSSSKIFDATFLLPNMNRNAKDEFSACHIPHAQFFDIDAIADNTSHLPHMVPTAEAFSEMMQDLGMNNDDKIILYDNSPFLSSARAWWLLKLFGKDNVFVLDGGLTAYKLAGGQISDGDVRQIEKGNFTSSEAMAQLITFDDLRDRIASDDNLQILDARPTARFNGTVPEPREGLRSGHMPGAINVPITDLIEKDTNLLLKPAKLKAIFDEAGLDFDLPAITSCGSGVTAAGLTLALAELGKYDIALYDGSWAEWGASDAPITCLS